jgi:predicted metal-binding membrane protein
MIEATIVPQTREPFVSRPAGGRTHSEATSHGAFLCASAVLFLISSTMTIIWSGSMSAMGEMPMPGGWVMSMTWMRMPEQTWLGIGASALGMWLVMMLAMMLPCLVPMLVCYRRTIETGTRQLGQLTALVGAGYFFVWALFGVAVLPLGFGLAALEMRQPALARAVPVATGVIVLIAGALQLSAWKVRELACCRRAAMSRRSLSADGAAAWRHGVRLGLHCGRCCINLMATLLVIGMMDLRMMALLTAALTLERVAPSGDRVARAIGVAVIVIGLALIARATHFA